MTVSEDNLRLAVRNVARHGDTDVLPFPLENHWLNDAEDTIVALLARIDFGLALANGQLEGVTIDLKSIGVGSPEQVLTKAAATLGANSLSDRTRGYILDQLKQTPQKPDLQAARAVGLLLGAPELQRR